MLLLADAGTAKSLHPCLLALVIREVDKATKGENGNDDVEHIVVGLLIEKFVEVVIDTQAGIFKVGSVAGLNVVCFHSLQDE